MRLLWNYLQRWQYLSECFCFSERLLWKLNVWKRILEHCGKRGCTGKELGISVHVRERLTNPIRKDSISALITWWEKVAGAPNSGERKKEVAQLLPLALLALAILGSKLMQNNYKIKFVFIFITVRLVTAPQIMEANMKRSLRRHHYNRLKRLRKKKWGYWDWHMPDKLAGFYANTACVCSCWMCGNPRRKFRAITRQEYIANMKLLEGCSEAGIFYPISLNQMGKIQW